MGGKGEDAILQKLPPSPLLDATGCFVSGIAAVGAV